MAVALETIVKQLTDSGIIAEDLTPALTLGGILARTSLDLQIVSHGYHVWKSASDTRRGGFAFRDLVGTSTLEISMKMLLSSMLALSVVLGMSAHRANSADKVDRDKIIEAWTTFKELDTNVSGELSRREFKGHLAGARADKAELLFERSDKNRELLVDVQRI